MANLRELKSQLLVEGVDGVIDEAEVEIIRQHVYADGHIDLEDMKFLVELRCEARRVCPAFEKLFFPALKMHILADGVVSLSEQFYLLKMLVADGKIDANEKKFLQELKREVERPTPEFDALYEQVMKGQIG